MFFMFSMGFLVCVFRTVVDEGQLSSVIGVSEALLQLKQLFWI